MDLRGISIIFNFKGIKKYELIYNLVNFEASKNWETVL